MTTILDTSTTHEDNAQAIRLDLQRLVQNIRGFTLLTSERRKELIVAGHVDDDFLRSMALLLDANPEVATSANVTGAEIRDHLNFKGSYQGVGEELMLNGRKAADTLLAEHADIGERALSALKISRGMKTPSSRASLTPHLETIDREFSRGRRKTRKPVAPKSPEVKP